MANDEYERIVVKERENGNLHLDDLVVWVLGHVRFDLEELQGLPPKGLTESQLYKMVEHTCNKLGYKGLTPENLRKAADYVESNGTIGSGPNSS